MKKIYFKSLLAALLLLCATVATAHDFEVDGIYYNITSSTNKTVAVTYKGSSYSVYSNEYSGAVTIPASVTYNGTTYSVTTIGNFAFEDCSSLTSVTIPNSVTTIGERAFDDCTSLTSVTIPNSVTTIGINAFSDCSSLTSVAIPNSVTTIELGAFSYCSSLASVTIPNSVTSIGICAFGYCNSLKSVTIPNSVTTIGNSAFEYCSSLTSVTIPNSVTSIGSDAFYECSSLTSVTIGNSVTTIGSNAFEDCSSLTSIAIPNSVTTIGSYAFSDCSSLTSVAIPNSVTTIEWRAFSDCSSLTSVTIPNSVTTIRSFAFAYCYSLESVTIGNSVTSIEMYAFEDCSSLKEIYCKAETPATIYYYTFYNSDSATLYVPRGAKDTYQSAEYWSNFANIVEMDFAITGDINGDDKVNVGDVTNIVSMILDPSAATDTADINGDGKVNVGDVTSLVSIILGTSNNAPARAAATRSADAPVVSASFDEDNTMYINVSNPDYPFTAAQFDLTIEGGISIVNDGEYYDVFLGSRTSSRNHSEPECAVQPDGSLRVVILSLKNKVFNGTEGDVATVSLDLTGVADGSYSYSIKNIVLSDPQSEIKYPADVEAWVNVAGGVTGINNIAADGENTNEAIYDLSGRKVANPVKGGVYIKGGKKIIM